MTLSNIACMSASASTWLGGGGARRGDAASSMIKDQSALHLHHYSLPMQVLDGGE